MLGSIIQPAKFLPEGTLVLRPRGIITGEQGQQAAVTLEEAKCYIQSFQEVQGEGPVSSLLPGKNPLAQDGPMSFSGLHWSEISCVQGCFLFEKHFKSMPKSSQGGTAIPIPWQVGRGT